MPEKSFRSIKLTTPPRTEREVMEVGREKAEEKFCNLSIIFLLCFCSLDMSGLFHNIYRSLMGFYAIAQFIEEYYRNRQKTVIPPFQLPINLL
jgi:hypothetical protein